MERKIAKLLGVAGILLSGAVALVPLTTYAEVSTETTGPGGYTLGVGNYTDYEFESGLTEEQIQQQKRILDDQLCENDPTSAYKCANISGTTRVNVTVENSISLDAAFTGTDDGPSIKVAPNMIGEGKITARVLSVADYTISLSAEQPNLTNATNTSFVIPALGSGETALTQGQSGWGVKKYGTEDYVGLTTADQVFYEGTATTGTGDGVVTTPLTVGVSAGQTQPNGLYSTNVTVTAAMKI